MWTKRIVWWPLNKCFTYGIALGIAAVSLMHSPDAMAAPAVINCGIATCSIYLTRNTTKELCEALCQYREESIISIGTAATVACAATGAGEVVSPICGGAAALFGTFFIHKVDQATQKRQCLRIRYIPGRATVPPVPTALYSDGSRFCHD